MRKRNNSFHVYSFVDKLLRKQVYLFINETHHPSYSYYYRLQLPPVIHKEPTEADRIFMEASRQELATKAVSERDMLFALVKEIAVDMEEEMKRLKNIISVTPVSAESGVREYSQLRKRYVCPQALRSTSADSDSPKLRSNCSSPGFYRRPAGCNHIMRKQLDTQASGNQNPQIQRLLKANSSIAEL